VIFFSNFALLTEQYVNIPEPVQYMICAVAVLFDLRCESSTYVHIFCWHSRTSATLIMWYIYNIIALDLKRESGILLSHLRSKGKASAYILDSTGSGILKIRTMVNAIFFMLHTDHSAYVILIPQARVLCLIYTHKPEGACVYIRQGTSACGISAMYHIAHAGW